MSALPAGGLESILWCYVCLGMRLGPSLVSLPPFSSAGVSLPVRLLLLSIVTLSVTPLLGMQLSIQSPQTLGIGIGVLVSELVFGAAIALSIHLFLAAFQTVGATLADLSGLSLDDAGDDAGIGNQVQRILVWVAGVLFVLAGGHRWALQLVIETLDRFPLGSSVDPTELLYEVPLRFGQALSIAIRLAFPAAMVMFAIGWARAWISRSLAAWDRLAVAGPLQVVALAWGLLMSFSAMGWLYQHELALWVDQQKRAVLEPLQWSSAAETTGDAKDG